MLSIRLKKELLCGARVMAQQLRELAALPGVLNSVSCIHMVLTTLYNYNPVGPDDLFLCADVHETKIAYA